MQIFDAEVVSKEIQKENWRKASADEFLKSLTTGLSTEVSGMPSDGSSMVSADEIRKRFEMVSTESLVTAREKIIQSVSSSIADMSKESSVLGKVLEEVYVLMMKKILDNPDGTSLATLQELADTLNSIRTTQVTTVKSFFSPTNTKDASSDSVINIIFNTPEAKAEAVKSAESLTANISNYEDLAQLADLANIVVKERPTVAETIIDVTPEEVEDDDE